MEQKSCNQCINTNRTTKRRTKKEFNTENKEKREKNQKEVQRRTRKNHQDIFKASKLKIIPLGGLHEVGKNITVFEYENDIIIVDCGLAFPEDDMLGVDLVIPEESWEQKISDVQKYDIDIVVMGSDWAGSDKFDYLKDYCEVVYLDRTEGISTTKIKRDLGLQEPINGVNQIPKTKQEREKEKNK